LSIPRPSWPVILSISVSHDALDGQQPRFLDRQQVDLDAVVQVGFHGQTATRLGKLLRTRRALSAESADGISAAIAQALDELSSEWGVDL
jgi:hypothetical protein